MHTELDPSHTPAPGAAGLRIGIAVSRYHAEITDALRLGAVRQFTDAGGEADQLEIVPVPGAFELTAVCRALADRHLDAIVAIGCVITGETTHDKHIASAVCHGLTSVTVQTGIPIALGVLTCATMEQARARAGGAKGNKGAEAMAAAIRMARIIETLGPTRAEA